MSKGFLILLALLSAPAFAEEPRVTLGFWEDSTWVRMTDRQGNWRQDACQDEMRDRAWGSTVPDSREFQRWDGVLSPLRPECHRNRKYRMLERAHAGLLVEEARWASEPDGFRFWAGSFHPTVFLTWAELKKTTALTGTAQLHFHYQREQTLESQRDLLRMTFTQKIGPSVAYLEVQPAFYKPEADLEAGAAWRSDGGRFQFRAGAVALDPFSNFIFHLIRSRAHEDTVGLVVEQRRPKLGTRVRAQGDFGLLRAELRAAHLFHDEARVENPAVPSFFRQLEDASYAGLLVEGRPLRWVTTGAWGSLVRSHVLRRSSAGDGRLDENVLRAGGFAIARPSEWLLLEAQGERVLRPERGSGILRDGPRSESETALQLDARVRVGAWAGALVGVVHDTWRVKDRDTLHLVDEGETYTFVRTRVEVRFGERTWARFGANGGFPKIFEGGNVVFYSLW